jgi:glycosyltransferase involved in cell wall biosynthesis
MSLGLIARADDGGIGIQTQEIARHLRPERILVVRVEPSRGSFDPGRFDGLCRYGRIATDPLSDDDYRWLVDGVTDAFAVEGFYSRYDSLIEIAAEAGVRLSVHANPELYPERYRQAARDGRLRTLVPTQWEIDRLDPCSYLQMPVATDRIKGRIRAHDARVFLHVSAPAMLDRNGTQLVMAAAQVYDGPDVTLLVAGPARPKREESFAHVHVIPLDDVDDYWQRYTADVDALIMPRRYGGLSLVAQEAFAAGLPVICLDRHPENTWPGTRLVPVLSSEEHKMKGGRFAVCSTSAEALAHVWAQHANSEVVDEYERPIHAPSASALSFAARRYARSISWQTLMPAWRAVFAQG